MPEFLRDMKKNLLLLREQKRDGEDESRFIYSPVSAINPDDDSEKDMILAE